MKKIIFAVAAVLIFTACKKNKTEEPSPTPVVAVPKVKTFTIGGDAVNYTYDALGRLLTRVSPSGNWKSEFTYSGNAVTENYYVGTTLSTTKVLELNADGFVVKEGYTFPATAMPYKSVYAYNANKQLQTKVSSNTINSNGSTETYFYTGAMLDSMRTSFAQNNDLYRFIYAYYTDKENSIAYKNQGYLFWFETAAMPLKKQTAIFKTNGFFNTQVDDYTYNYDAQNRIIKRTITMVGGSTPSVNDITYY